MDFTFEIQGLDKLLKVTGAVSDEVEKEVAKGLFASAKKIEGDAKRSILNGEKTGRTYKRGNVLHRASAPGQAPASDTGWLVNSINSYLGERLTALVVAGRGLVSYARHLEFGTSKMAARPFMFPAVEQNREWITARLATAIRTALANVSSRS